MKYWVFLSKKQEGGAYLSAIPEDGPKAYKYDEATPLKDGYPKQEDAVMCMSSMHPDDLDLVDVQACLDSVLVINTKVKKILDDAGIVDVEYLPITIWDHQKKPASSDYMIMNPLNVIDMIDMENSDYERNSFFPDQITTIDDLVIDHKNIPKDNDKLFRAKTMMDTIFVNDDIYKALKGADIKGAKFLEAEGWDGLDF